MQLTCSVECVLSPLVSRRNKLDEAKQSASYEDWVGRRGRRRALAIECLGEFGGSERLAFLLASRPPRVYTWQRGSVRRLGLAWRLEEKRNAVQNSKTICLVQCRVSSAMMKMTHPPIRSTTRMYAYELLVFPLQAVPVMPGFLLTAVVAAAAAMISQAVLYTCWHLLFYCVLLLYHIIRAHPLLSTPIRHLWSPWPGI